MELVDVYPTVAELAGVPVPADAGLDGASLVPLMSSPSGAPALPPRSNASEYALSVYPRCPANLSDPSRFWAANDCTMVERTAFPFMGVSLRTGRWRYTEWLPWNASLQVAWGGPAAGVELYDHDGDTGALRGRRASPEVPIHPRAPPVPPLPCAGTSFDGPWEQANLAGLPAYAAAQAQLAALLREAYPNQPAWGQR